MGTPESKKKILVVDDQPELRKSISRILKMAGYDFVEASDGKVALHLLGTEKIDMVVTDIRMPEMHGIELLHNVKRSFAVPVIMMTGFSEIIETTEAYEIGVDGFLLKPFKQDDLLNSIRDAFAARQQKHAKVAAEKPASISEKYCGIPVGEFVSGREIKFPVFLKLSEEKFVRIAFCGEDLPADKVEGLKNKGIKFLYLQREDFRSYVDFTAKISEAVSTNQSLESSTRARVLKHSSEMIFEYAFSQHVDKEVFELARKNVEQSLSLLTDSSKLLGILDLLTSHSTALYAHSMGVSLVASLIAKASDWKSSVLFFRIVAGGVFHDIGKKDLPADLLSKAPAECGKEELTLLQSHAKIGADLLSSIEGLPSEVSQIVLHHHELCDGSGYPTGLGSSRIHPVAKVIACADEFCKLYRGAPGYGSGMDPKAAILEMERRNRSSESSAVKWEMLPALKKVFSLP